MTIEKLRSAYDAKPFQPFTLHLADGKELTVKHRDFMLSVPDGRTIVVAQADGSMNIIDLLLVTDLDFEPRANGKKKRAKKRK